MNFNTARSALGWGLLALALSTLAPVPAASAEEVVEIKTRPGVTVKFILRGPRTGNPPIAILFAGSEGVIDLDNWDGSGNPTGNFLVRTRKHWVKHNLLVAVPDAPSDMQDGMTQWRTSADHATDIRAVIAYLRCTSAGPVFLVGTSRGTISAAGIAAHLAPGELGGIVLTATVTRYNRAGEDRVQSVKLEKIRVPVLLAHHQDDLCYATVFEDLPALAKEFTGAPRVDIKGYKGGGNYRGSECRARSAHGFRGIEKRVVRELAAWIRAVAGTGR
ncbi:MAG: alpha/beta hydrolase [Alphaproteobacteria bacterium]|nr:alpha/beta hydrolase [Alphaproteobacteria bacterium]